MPLYWREVEEKVRGESEKGGGGEKDGREREAGAIESESTAAESNQFVSFHLTNAINSTSLSAKLLSCEA